MGNRKLDLSALRGAIGPDLEMSNRSPHELERGLIARPPYSPYVISDSLAAPWMPTNGARNRERREMADRSENLPQESRVAGLIVRAISPLSDSIRLIRRLGGRMIGFRWIGGESHPTRHHYRYVDNGPRWRRDYLWPSGSKREIRKISPKRSPNTDYLDFLSNTNAGNQSG